MLNLRLVSQIAINILKYKKDVWVVKKMFTFFNKKRRLIFLTRERLTVSCIQGSK